MAVDPSDITLSPQQRQLLAKLAEETGKPYSDLLDELLATVPLGARPEAAQAEPEKSLYDVLSERGMLGCFDGPADLSTNPKHMEGFGRGASSDSD